MRVAERPELIRQFGGAFEVAEQADHDDPRDAGADQRIGGPNEELRIETELGQFLRTGSRADGVDRGVVTVDDRGDLLHVGDITAHGGRQIGMAGEVADDGGHGVSTATGLDGDGAAGPAARPEDSDGGHVRHARSATRGYRNETGATLHR